MKEIIKIKLDNLIFDCITYGCNKNELVIFLHGWPETSNMWEKIMSHFSQNGFYCVAPNLRGYSKEACPEGKEHYSLDKLVNDVLGIFNFFNKPKFHLVGHDWGALIGWKLVHDNEDKILSWTAISVPHPKALGKAMLIDKEQMKMSEYVKNFQTPNIPEKQIIKDDYQMLRNLWKNSTEDEVNEYLKVFSNPKQLTASLNYYRSNYEFLKSTSKNKTLENINAPTLFIWGNKDIAIGKYSVSENHQYMKNEYKFLELNSGHWLIQTKYNELKKAISSHLYKNKMAHE